MNTYSQTPTAPPTPPTPPSVSANTTTSGVTYAKSETEDSYAFSCTFSEKDSEKVATIISNEFKNYSDEYLNRKFTKSRDNEYFYKIELASTELKLEYRFEKATAKDRKKISSKFEAIERDILKL